MSKFSLFFGAATALITPFEQNGELDLESFRKLLRFQLDDEIDALLVCGTTGEAPTLTDDEAALLLSEAVRTAQKSVPVIMGIGSNCTAHAVANAQKAEKGGADALLAVKTLVFDEKKVTMAEMKQALADNFGKGILARKALELTTTIATELAAGNANPRRKAILSPDGSPERCNTLYLAGQGV